MACMTLRSWMLGPPLWEETPLITFDYCFPSKITWRLLWLFFSQNTIVFFYDLAHLSYTVWLFDWLISISGVYPLGCYQTNFFRATILRSITGSNVIQQCISAAAASRQNYQGIGIMKVVSNYNCYADTQADLRYSQYSSKKCSSSLNAANETVAFLFTGITIHK